MRDPTYLISALKKFLLRRGQDCPSCGSRTSVAIDRKWIVTALCRCANCQLLFRSPTTTEAENAVIYDRIYREGFTTDIPGEETISRLLATKFKGHEKDYDSYVQILTALGVNKGARVLDFGCSWGYGSYQLTKVGFDVDGLEISEDRAAFAARRLGVRMKNETALETGAHDVFFSSQVIEHVPSVRTMLETGFRVLKPGGLFVAFTPNGSEERRRVDPAGWHSAWGFVHPQLIDEKFIFAQLARTVRFVTSSPHSLKEIRDWDKKSSFVGTLSGGEFMFAAIRPTGGEPITGSR